MFRITKFVTGGLDQVYGCCSIVLLFPVTELFQRSLVFVMSVDMRRCNKAILFFWKTRNVCFEPSEIPSVARRQLFLVTCVWRNQCFCASYQSSGGQIFRLYYASNSILQADKCVLLWRLFVLFSRHFAHLWLPQGNIFNRISCNLPIAKTMRSVTYKDKKRKTDQATITL